jgi:hypothetical protein
MVVAISSIWAMVAPISRIAPAVAPVASRRLDLVGDLLGRFRGLGRQRLHFACHHGKALARLAGPRGFDGGVQGQQVGLCGDVLNEPHHLADLLCRLQQSFHHGVGAAGLGHGALRDR